MANSSSHELQLSVDQLEVVNIPIDTGLSCLRVLSPRRLRFELEYALERGSTDNCFLFIDRHSSQECIGSAVLVHPPGAIYAEVFLPALVNFLPIGTSEIQIVVGHVNPNRVQLLRQLVDLYPHLQLISSNPGSKLIKELWTQQKPIRTGDEEINRPSLPPLPTIHVIRQEQQLVLSGEHNLRLIPAPTPRWPGGLLAFEETLGLLMSDKFFAAHICTNTWSEITRSSTEEERRHFYDCLMCSMSTQVDSVLDRLDDLDIQIIAPGHGPAIASSWRSLLNEYRRWGEAQHQAPLNVVLLFASAYGNTAAIADALSRGITRTGIRVQSLNCEFTPSDQLVKAIREADGYLIGSPTLGGHAPTPIVSALGTLLSEGDKRKKVGVFGSYGWSGEALDLLESKLRDGGFVFGFEPIKVKFSPDTAMVKILEEKGTLFGRDLLRTKKLNKRRPTGGMSSSRSDPAVLALGRVIGSLCVLTARKDQEGGVLTGAMLASWISQASFSPPGLTISVAKDRAVESLLHVGDSFCLNLLGEANKTAVMRHFLQPFSPGADRFEGVEVLDSPLGHPILASALAWIDCCVKQRMECGDHWLIYAEATNGNVCDKEDLTAVHHRRTGANY